MQNYFLGESINKQINEIENSTRAIQSKMLEGLKSKTAPLYLKVAFISRNKSLSYERDTEIKKAFRSYLKDAKVDVDRNEVYFEHAIKNIQSEIKKIQNNFKLADFKEYILNNSNLKEELTSSILKDYREPDYRTYTYLFIRKTIEEHGGNPTTNDIKSFISYMKPEISKIIEIDKENNRNKLESEIRNKFDNNNFIDLLKKDDELFKTIMETSQAGTIVIADSVALYFNERGLNFSSNDALDLLTKPDSLKLINKEVSFYFEEKAWEIRNHMADIEETYGIKVTLKPESDEIRRIERRKFNANIKNQKHSNKIEEIESNDNKTSKLDSTTDNLHSTTDKLHSTTDNLHSTTKKRVRFTKDTKDNSLQKGELPFYLRPQKSGGRDMNM